MHLQDVALIKEYLACILKLRDAKIVRSGKILGDIGEWLCIQQFGLVPETSGRHPGYDGKIGNSRVQVKVHNSPEGTNLNVGNPENYDELIVILGPHSRLRIGHTKSSFNVYRFSSSNVTRLMKNESGFYCARAILENEHPEIIKF
jgi:hypothetical protein